MHKMLVSLEEKMQMQRTVFMYHHGVFKLLINIYIQTVHESQWSRVMSRKEISFKLFFFTQLVSRVK